MDVHAELRKGLLSKPKFVPLWYAYDKQGSEYNDRCLMENKCYYFHRCEVQVIKKHLQDIVQDITSPCVLVDMGSGNMVKTRFFIDALLSKQTTLTYIPVDISADFLEESAKSISSEYGDCLNVIPVAGDYSVGTEKLRDVKGAKMILWLGGFQNELYDKQVQRIRTLSTVMDGSDTLLITLDVTQDATAILNAYNDPAGTTKDLYMNSLWRLNREQGANFHTQNFRVDIEYIRHAENDRVSGTIARAVSKKKQSVNLPGLNMTIDLENGEPINLFEGETLSCKYTLGQIQTLMQKGGLILHRIWTDDEEHVGLVSVRKDL